MNLIKNKFALLFVVVVTVLGAFYFIEKRQTTNEQTTTSNVISKDKGGDKDINTDMASDKAYATITNEHVRDKFLYLAHIDPQNQIDAHTGMVQPGDVVKFIWSGCATKDADISIELEDYGSKVGEMPFEQVKNPGDILIAENIPNTGKFDWIIPQGLMIGSQSIFGVFIPRIRSQACDSSLNDKYTIEIQPL